MSRLDRLLAPESIALVGASGDETKLSGRPHRYLEKHGYTGECYFVNPNRDRIDGERCYDSVTELPTVPDLAMILVPAAVTPDVVAECGEAGISYAIIIASGFGETDAEGVELEEHLVNVATEGDVRLLGPNSEGLLNLHETMAATFSSICKRDTLRPGPVGFISQSGAFGGAMFQLIQDVGIGASSWISTGNEADIDSLELLDALIGDAHTETVAMYIEALEDGHRLFDLQRRAIEAGVAVVAIHVGTSERGRQATASHTGNVASDRDVYDALLRQAGVMRVRSVDAFVDTVKAVTQLPSGSLPQTTGGLGIVSMSGGAAALCADTAGDVGLPLATLDASTEATIESHIPDYGSAKNPLDVTGYAIGNPKVFGTCIDALAGDPSVNALLIQFGNSGHEVIETVMDAIVQVNRSHSYPVMTVFTGSRPRQAIIEELESWGILVYEDPVRAIKTCKHLFDRAVAVDRLGRTPPRGGQRDTRAAPFPMTDLTEAINRLEEYGVNFVDTRVIDRDDDRGTAAIEAAEALGYPVVVKASPLEVSHKTEAGGVHTDIDSASALRDVLDTVEDEPLVMQRQPSGIEALVGISTDEDFGPVMTVGPGGVYVELFESFAHRALPIDKAVAEEMIAETPLDRLLRGFRGSKGDVRALSAFAVASSEVYLDHELTTLEFNPVIVTEDEAVAVDLLIE